MDLISKFKNQNDFKYLSDGDIGRISQYSHYQQILEGEHEKAFNVGSHEQDPDRRDEIDEYIVANFAGLISRISADFLFGEEVGYDVGSENEDTRKALDGIVDRSNLQRYNWEAAHNASAWGDVVIKVRTNEDGKALVEYTRPSYYIPVFENDNMYELKGVILAWKRKIDDQEYLRVEIHEPETITNQLWSIKDGKCEAKVDLDLHYDGVEEVEETGVDRILVKLIPNYSYIGRHFGISDYHDVESLMKAINNRLSRIETALNRYADPILAVPTGVLDEKGKVKRGNLKMFEVSGGGSSGLVEPKYITWDAKLDSAFDEISHLVDQILMISETAKAAIGEDKGGQKESGRALKFKLIRTLAKVARKRRYFSQGLTYALETALMLEGVGEEDVKVNLKWKDGLPADHREEAEVNEILLRSGQVSLEEVVRSKMMDASEQEIKQELKRLEEEKQFDVNTPERDQSEDQSEKDE